MICKFILTRGKNKDKECGKNNCKRHVLTTEKFQDIVQPILIEKNSNIGKCLHNIVFLECDECKNNTKLGQCNICNINGDLDKIKQHVTTSHKILIIPPNYTSFKKIIAFHIDKKIKCPKNDCTNELCNIQENHMQVIKPLNECIHPFDSNLYCRICISKRGKKSKYCNLCQEYITKPGPTKHIWTHIPRIKCDICKNTKPHTHKLIYPKCKLCNFEFSTHLTDKMMYTHLVQNHKPIKKCQVGCTGTECNHVDEYELYNSINTHKYINLVKKYDIDINDLLYTKLKYPEQEILRRIDTIINNQKEIPHIYTIPDDIWGIISSYLSIESKYNMRFVSKRFNKISNVFMTKFEKFQYYCTYKIYPEKLYMCASLAKSTFCLTQKDLNDLQCTLKTNPHYRSAAPMRMYTKQDLIRITFQKYKTVQMLKEVVADKEKKKQIRTQIKANIIQERTIELRTALASRGLQLRDDSRVCNGYIQHGHGPNGETLTQVIEIMIEMEWYFRHEYQKIFNNIKHNYYGWYDITEVSQEAKVFILRKYKHEHKPIVDLPTNVLILYNRI